MKFWIIGALLFMAFALQAETDLPGKKLFREKCKACHNIDKKLVGPALKGLSERRDSSWIYNFILGSTAMVNSGDSTAVALFNQFNKIPMPDQILSMEEIGDILTYIKDESTPKAITTPFDRPEVSYAFNFKPIRFSEFIFWLPFTLFVLILIGAMYYQSFLYDVQKGRIVKENTD